MTKIGIDARLYFQTGVGVYLRNLISNLQKLSPPEFSFFIYLLKEDAGKIVFKNKRFIKRTVNDRWHSINEQTRFLREVSRDNLDLMHFTYFGYPVLYTKVFIVTIHDLTLLFFKSGKSSTKSSLLYSLKHSAFRYVVNSQIKNSRAIITPSKNIKKQIVDFFGSKYSSKITPIYEGLNIELIKAKENSSLKKKFKQPFLIYVGNFYPHKNIDRLIMAFSNVEEKLQLILVGPNDFFAQRTHDLIKQLKLETRVILYTNPRIEDFVYFYKNAKAIIHPSFSEGFGLPLVEAMYFKLPIIASNIDVFKEILTDKYISFDPYDISDIKNAIDSLFRQKRGFDYSELLKEYSFEEMTKKTLEVYNKVIGHVR